MLLSRPMIRVLLLALALVSANSAAAPQEPSAPASASVPIVMYSTSWCPYCAKARAYFESNHIEYVEHDIEASADAKAEFKRLHGRVVPLILVGRERLDGFSELSFEFALERASR